MRHENDQPMLTVKTSSETFSNVINRQYINDATRERLSRANVLMIPNEGYGDRTDLIYFPSGTTELFHFLSERRSENLNVDICIEEKDYKEVSLHADWLILAGFLVVEIVAPLFVELLAEYIKQHLGKRESEMNVKSKLIIRQDEEAGYVEYLYEGPASDYHDVMIKALSKTNDSELHLRESPKSKRKRRTRKKS